jgi:hypothetical protein
LAPIEKWVKTSMREHPYPILVATGGAAFLAGAFMRRLAALGAGVTLGLLSASYFSRKGAGAVPMGPEPTE